MTSDHVGEKVFKGCRRPSKTVVENIGNKRDAHTHDIVKLARDAAFFEGLAGYRKDLTPIFIIIG